MSKPHYPTRTDSRLTSRYGSRTHPITKKKSFHYGLDLAPRVAGTRGVPIYAVRDGVVTARFFDRAGGNMLRLKHDNENISTGYHHLDLVKNKGMLVKVGERVKEGQRIGTMGTTGSSTGIHLHFEVIRGKDFNRNSGNHMNPETYLNTRVNQLVEDGKWGKQTTEHFQRLEQMRHVDGVISHQWKSRHNENLYSAKFDKTQRGSRLIRRLQRQLGVTVDGLCGEATIRAMQRKLGTPVDGVISPVSSMVRQMQRRLNRGIIPFK